MDFQGFSQSYAGFFYKQNDYFTTGLRPGSGKGGWLG